MLESVLSILHWPALARIHLSQDPGKQSLHSQPPEIEHGNEKDKDRTEGKRARTGTKVYTSLHLGNCLFNKTDCKCFRDLRWVTSSLMWPLKFNMLPRNLTLSIRTQILIGSHATAGGQVTAP